MFPRTSAGGVVNVAGPVKGRSAPWRMTSDCDEPGEKWFTLVSAALDTNALDLDSDEGSSADGWGTSGSSGSFHPANGSASGTREMADEGKEFMGAPKPNLRPKVGRTSADGDPEASAIARDDAPSAEELGSEAKCEDRLDAGVDVSAARSTTTSLAAVIDDGEGESAANAESETGSCGDRISTTRR